MWFPRSLRLAPIDTLKKHRQLRSCQSYSSACRLRPHEASSLQSLLKQAQPVSVPPQQLDKIAALAAENENMSGKGRLFQHSLHQSGEPLKATPQISEPGGYPDTSSATKLDHRNKLSSMARTSTGSIPASTLTNARPGNSMWIDPDGTGGGGTSGTIALLGSAANVTGSSSARVF
jgi:hypothetical protein